MTLSDRIQQLISKNGTSQSELEKTLGFGKGTISKWKGSTAPSADKLQKIAEYFGVTIDYLMTGKVDSEKEESEITAREKRIMEYARQLMDMGITPEDLESLIDIAQKMGKKD